MDKTWLKISYASTFFFFLSDQIFKMAERVNKAVNGKGFETGFGRRNLKHVAVAYFNATIILL